MAKPTQFEFRPQPLTLLSLALLFGGCSSLPGQKPSTSSSGAVRPGLVSNSPQADCSKINPFARGLERATRAAILSQTARSPQEWNAVVLRWLQAIEGMQAVPLNSPKRLFAEKKAIEYEQNLAVARLKGGTATTQLPFSSFSSQFLNRQLTLFLSHTAAVGTPDILIVGSSRALQGVEPRQLQFELAKRGKPNLKIFNLGVNGATAQVVDLIVRELLAAEQLPQLIIWADGVRAFNSGVADRTYRAIASSPGYQRLRQGDRPTLPADLSESDRRCQPASQLSLPHALRWLNPLRQEAALATDINAIDANGFLPDASSFNPAIYYRTHPRVAGRYDRNYQNLTFQGEQATALSRLAAYTQAQQIPLVVVNLPLTQDYLDSVRQRAEQQFRTFMTQQSRQQNFIFLDLSANPQLRNNRFFADPSHLNQLGGREVARQLAAQSQIPWPDARKRRKDFSNLEGLGSEE